MKPLRPEDEAIGQMVEILRSGGVIVFPTETFYGLGVHALCPKGLGRVYALKGRPRDLPLLCLLDGFQRLNDLVEAVPSWAEQLMAAFWPGPLTLILPARKGLPPQLVGSTGGVAVRWTSHPLAGALVSRLEAPVVGTSANPSGGPAPARLQDLAPALKRRVDGILDGGELPGQRPSTLLDCTGHTARLLREGAIPRSRLEEVFALG